jgi:hypothetical protein
MSLQAAPAVTVSSAALVIIIKRVFHAAPVIRGAGLSTDSDAHPPGFGVTEAQLR